MRTGTKTRVWAVTGGLLLWVLLVRMTIGDHTASLGAAVVTGCSVAALAVFLLIRRDRRARSAGGGAISPAVHMRTEFGRAAGMLSRLLGSAALLPVPVAATGVVVVWEPVVGLMLLLAMAMGLVPAAVIAATTVPQLLRTRRLVVGPDGVQLHGRRTITILWRDITSWWVAVPPGRASRFVGRVAVLATPAAHVRDPKAGGRNPLWLPAAGGWRVCDPQLLDGSVDEVTAAFELYASEKRRPAPTAPTHSSERR